VLQRPESVVLKQYMVVVGLYCGWSCQVSPKVVDLYLVRGVGGISNKGPCGSPGTRSLSDEEDPEGRRVRFKVARSRAKEGQRDQRGLLTLMRDRGLDGILRIAWRRQEEPYGVHQHSSRAGPSQGSRLTLRDPCLPYHRTEATGHRRAGSLHSRPQNACRAHDGSS
jgi:hypothetical protein